MTVLLSAHIKTDIMLVRRKVITTMKHFIAKCRDGRWCEI